jgi:Na+/H+-dicarboxylate symporter
MLILALILAYVSSIGAALAATFAGYSILPFLNIATEVDSLKSLPELVFALAIPQIMPVMSALFLSITVGLAAAWNRSKLVIGLLEEFQKIVLSIVNKFLIPVLPILIGTTFCGLAYEGSITKQFPVFIAIILIVIIGHYLWMALLYFIAGVYSGKNPFYVIGNYGPAYMTAIGTMSSAATLSVALECARKSEPTLRDDLVNFGIPLFANIHLCGSVMTETFFVMAVSKILYGVYPSVGHMILFCALLGVFAIGAPGVPGGTVMASLGLITGVLGFDASGTALMLTIFALQDSFGTACNVTSDGALTLILTGYAEKHKIENADLGNLLS